MATLGGNLETQWGIGSFFASASMISFVIFLATFAKSFSTKKEEIVPLDAPYVGVPHVSRNWEVPLFLLATLFAVPNYNPILYSFEGQVVFYVSLFCMVISFIHFFYRRFLKK